MFLIAITIGTRPLLSPSSLKILKNSLDDEHGCMPSLVHVYDNALYCFSASLSVDE